MPVVIPILAAVSSYGGAAALVGGTFTVANVAAGLTFLGSMLSIAGTVTKNEKLSKIGNGMMIVGGATSIINNLAGGAPAGAAPAESAPAPTPAPAAPAAGNISAPPPAIADTGALTPAPAPLNGQGALSSASNNTSPSLVDGASALPEATNSVAAAPTAAAPTAPSAAPDATALVNTPPPSPSPGIIGSFLKENAAGMNLLGHGITGAYTASVQEEIAKRKMAEEQRIREFEEHRRRQFNDSVTGSRINVNPWPTAPTPNAPALQVARPLIGTVRGTA